MSRITAAPTLNARHWRNEDAWKLVFYSEAHFAKAPPDRPTAAAELSQPPVWASEYHGNRIVATWFLDKGNLL